jgi:TolA-binding protein
MPKPAITILAIAVLVLTAILAVFVLRQRNEGKDRREKSPAESAEATPGRERTAAPTSPPAARIATERPVTPAPPSPSPAPLVAEPRPPVPADRSAGARLDEASLISRLHDLAASDPPRSLELAREAVARFPDSPNAPEFQWNVVKALANMDRYKEAEEEARGMVERFPGNAFADDVEHHLLNHPPNPPQVPDP